MNSDAVRRAWAGRSGEYSPQYYAYHGPNDTSDLLRSILDRRLDRDDAILELGCSSGRHLAHLEAAGFHDLTGVDVNTDAGEVMAEEYPNLSAAGTFHFDAMENVVDGFDDDRFDAVFAVETLQHVHPDASWVFGELVRITDGLLVTAENETAYDSTNPDEADFVDEQLPLYARDWNRVFTDLGCEAVDVVSTERDTVRTFRVAPT